MEYKSDKMIWAKLPKLNEGKYFWGDIHPNICHSIEVGTMAIEILDKSPEKTKKYITEFLDIPFEKTKKYIGFLSSLHDIGKITPSFQMECKNAELTEYYKKKYGFCQNVEWQPHGPMGLSLLKKYLPNIPIGYLISTASHHGYYEERFDGGNSSLGFPYKHQYDINNPWRKEQENFISDVSKHFGVTEKDLCDFGKYKHNQEYNFIIITSIISEADWIVSEYFENAGVEVDLEKHFLSLPDKCKNIIEKIRLCDEITIDKKTVLNYNDILKINSLRPGQSAAYNIIKDKNCNYIMIIEDGTGSGKTAIGQMAILEGIKNIGHIGSYSGMPTCVTANKMHDRLKEMFREVLYKEPMLVHSNSSLLDFENKYGEKCYLIYNWYKGGKRKMLFPFCIGTIDQPLMGVVNSRHFFLRLFSMMNKVIIFDEIHAFDTYTTDLFEKLLSFLGALGSSCILLSATLPKRKVKRFINAWSGKNTDFKISNYPRITYIDSSSEIPSCVTIQPENKIEYKMNIINNDYNTVLSNIKKEIQNKEKNNVCVFCNTIKKSQELFKKIKAEFSENEDIELKLIHANNPQEWRDEYEKDLIEKYGKEGFSNGKRPKKSIVVGTQILEMSLDISFDVGFIFFCPIDSILQRLGRIGRFDIDKKEFYIIVGNSYKGCPPNFNEDIYIYDHYYLLKTYIALILNKRESITIPNDVETLIEEVDSPIVSKNLSQNFIKVLEDSKFSSENKESKSLFQSKEISIPLPNKKFFSEFSNIDKISEDISDEEDIFMRDDGSSLIYDENYKYTTRKSMPNVKVLCVQKKENGYCFYGEDIIYQIDKIFDMNNKQDLCLIHKMKNKLVNIRNRTAVDVLLSMGKINNWQNINTLSYSRILLMDENWKATLDNGKKIVEVKLTKEYGLEIR